MGDRSLCMPLKTLTDGPLFGRPPGTLSDLQNMNILPGGYAEARGGTEKLQPLGGTPADPISAGGVSAAIQVSTSYGWIRTFDSAAGAGTQYSANRQLHPGNWRPFPTGVLNDAIYFGSDSPFSRIGFDLSTQATWVVTIVYEYWNGAAWTALTTSETVSFTVFDGPGVTKFASWSIPTDWAATSIGDAGTGNVYKYWMRIRLSAVTSVTTHPTISYAVGQWVGTRDLYCMTASPRGGATNGKLLRYGQSGTTAEFFSIDSALYSGSAAPYRAVHYAGRLMFVNGKEQKRWDGNVLSDLGLLPPGTGTTATATAGAGLGAGVWRYYIAFGYGPVSGRTTNHTQDERPLYGASQATFIAEVTTTGGANERVTIDWTALTIPADVSCLNIYRTENISTVPAADRPDHPAFEVISLEREYFTVSLTFVDGVVTTKYFPRVEAILYSNLPPKRCKFLTIFQNRLLLGDDLYWYWSDPFQPDSFNLSVNYLPLTRAAGGRNMGGSEFADQTVLWTEDQTWGLTNIDLDVPNLYPISPSVGCVAPDAAASGDGLLIWPARDGFYAWDGGSGLPVKISGDMDQTFGAMSFETIGGSTATIHDQKYDIRFASPDNSTIGDSWRFDMQSGTWSKIVLAGFTSTLFPIANIHAPLGNRDPGGLHSIWAKRDYGTGAGNYSLFLGDLTTQDNGNNFTCQATMHFPLDPSVLMSPSRVITYYQAADGWGTPTLAFATSSIIGSAVGALTAGSPDTADDYSVLGGTFAESNRGTSDLKVTFSVASAAGGTVMRQRFFGGVIEGVKKPIRKGMI